MNLSRKDQQFLLELARNSISAKIQNKILSIKPPDSEILSEKRGAFVTLTKQGELRGCIGFVEGIKPLYETIKEMAVAAAFNDPRFNPVTAKELGELEIEISVLSPLKQIHDSDEISVGTHGILLRKGIYQGLLLPQVATHYGWDRNMFLDQTCVKAGMTPGCWNDRSVSIFIFSADIFSESEFK